MGKKMKLPFLFRSSSDVIKPSSWPWPACNLQPRTLSFRTPDDVLMKTMNTAYLDKDVSSTAEGNESCGLPNSMESPSFSTQNKDQYSGGDQAVEMVIRGLKSDRLFFEPGKTSSILTDTTKPVVSSSSELPLKEKTMLVSLDSQDPYMDFKNSMAEMVEAHGLKDWKSVEELLFWYLRVNEKNNHEYILGAFVDLLVGLSFLSSSSSSYSTTSCSNLVSSSSTSYSPCSPLSFYTSNSSSLSSSTTPCVSSLRVEDVEEEEEDIDLSCSCLSPPLELDKKIVHVKDDDASSYNYCV